MRMWDDRKPADGPTMTSMSQGSPLFCLSWSSSGDMIAAGSENGEVHFFDPRSIEEPLQKWQGHADSVRRVAMLPGGSCQMHDPFSVSVSVSVSVYFYVSVSVPDSDNLARAQIYARFPFLVRAQTPSHSLLLVIPLFLLFPVSLSLHLPVSLSLLSLCHCLCHSWPLEHSLSCTVLEPCNIHNMWQQAT